jgi:hypothetical protein
MRTSRRIAAVATAAAATTLCGGFALAQTAPPAPQTLPRPAPAAAATPAAPPAAAPAPATPAAPATESVSAPRRPGTFTAGTVSTMRYTPNCGAFEIGMDAEAIQNATSRAFLQEQQTRYNGLQARWEAWQDCITVNAQVDYDQFEPLLSRTVRGKVDADVANFNAVAAAPAANVSRVQALRRPPPPPPPRNRRGQQPAEAAAPAVAPTPPGVPPITWTTPTGRFPGVFSGGRADQMTYAFGCPEYRLEVTANDFNTTQDPLAFNAMVEILRSAPERLTPYHQCLADQANQDLQSLDEVVNGGADAVLRPAAEAYGRQRAEIQRQLNLHREPGGLLAAGDAPRRPAAPATPARPRRPR